MQFPFGHGHSYTQFTYSDLEAEAKDGAVTVRAVVKNTGDRDGAEVVQLYVRNNRGEVFKADKELRGFTRVHIPAGAAVPVEISFPLSDLAYWDVAEHGWVLENGDYEIVLAASARDPRLHAPLIVTSGRDSHSPYPAAVDRDYATPPAQVPASFPALLGRDLPPPMTPRRLTMETRLIDARRTLIGAIMLRMVSATVRKDYQRALALPDGLERDAQVKNAHFVLRMMPFQSLRSMAMSSGGALPYNVARGIAEFAAWHPIRALKTILRKGLA